MRSGSTRRYARVLLPLLVLGAAALGARAILSSRPDAAVRPERATVATVEATRLAPADYPIVVESRGTVRPLRENTLVAEVAGSVAEVADAFVVGGRFAGGEPLLEIDRRDYRIALARARANLAQADARLAEEEALAEQARLEWRALGRSGEPSALTLREPQLAAARAERDAAAAELERAELDLARTRVTAPYDGRVLERAVDPGQFVARGAVLGRVHASDALEVALPIDARALERVALPDAGVGGGAAVELETTHEVGGGARPWRWQGRLARVEGIDETTQQLVVVARIDAGSGGALPRVGRFVRARIAGEVLEDVFVIPRRALRGAGEVLLVDEDGRIERRAVRVAWADGERAAVVEGLAAGELLVLTALSAVTDGTPVRAIVDGVAPPLEPERAPGAGPDEAAAGRAPGAAPEGRRAERS